MSAEDPAEKIHACSTNSSAKRKRFILQFATVTPLSTRRVCECDTLSNSYRPGLFKIFGRGPHQLLHNSSRARHLVYCDFFGMCYILSNQHIFRKYIIFSLLAKCVLRPGEMDSQVGFCPRAVVWKTLI